jgi:hypothetical protein
VLRVLSRHGGAALVAGLLAGLSLAVPLVNAGGGPPRALFLQLPADAPEPAIGLSARRVADGGWLLVIAAENFRFTAVCLTSAAAVPVGHAHVLRGDRKLASAYAPAVPLGRLEPGVHRFRVVLRGQDHRALLGRRGLIEAELTLEVPGPRAGG